MEYVEHPVFIHILAWPLLITMEVFFMSLFGSTLGKKVFRIRLTDISGNKLALIPLLKRTVLVWYIGLGLSLPAVNLVFIYFARKRLIATGNTLWDMQIGSKITHSHIGKAYYIWVAIVTFMAILLIFSILSIDNQT